MLIILLFLSLFLLFMPFTLQFLLLPDCCRFQVLRHDFRASQLTDAHKDSTARLNVALDEHKALAAAWDIER
jgi:hypothetical protein